MHIIAPHMSCVVNLPLSADQPDELETALAAGYAEIYVITPAGIIKHHKLRGTNRYLRVKVEAIPGYQLPVLDQEINFLPAGKIPKELFDEIVAFFYAVIEKKGAALEAMAHILWNPTQGYHIGIPAQQISAAAVKYDWSYIPSGTSVICDVHSHNHMQAFFSGTDNADDKANISFSGVVGKMQDPTIMTVWRFNYQDRKFEAKFEDIFETVQTAVPEAWLDQIEVTKPRATTYGKGQFIGRADHLKDHQFKKGDKRQNTDVNSGNRAGPHVRKWDDLNERGYADNFLGADFGFTGYGGFDRDLGDSVFANVTEDALTGGNTSGKALGEGASHENQSNTEFGISALSPVMEHEQWDTLVINKGENAADAFCTIDTIMYQLSEEDELLEPLIADMFKLGSERGRLKMFKAIYESLSTKDQQSLANSGF